MENELADRLRNIMNSREYATGYVQGMLDAASTIMAIAGDIMNGLPRPKLHRAGVRVPKRYARAAREARAISNAIKKGR